MKLNQRKVQNNRPNCSQLWQDLSESESEAVMTGGAIALPSFLNQANKAKETVAHELTHIIQI